MHLIWFLTIATILSTVFGEFGQYPFGTTSFSISLTDLLLFLSLAVLAIWQIGIKKKIILPKLFKLLILFYGFAFLTLLLSGNLSGGFYLIRFIIYSLSFYLGFLLVHSKVMKLDDLLTAVVISGLIVALLGFLQLFLLPDLAILTDFGFDPHKNRLVSTSLDPNFTGVILDISLMLVLYLYFKQKRLVWVIAGLILAVALILTFSRSAYLMFIFEFMIFAVFRARKLLLIFLLVVLLVYLTIPRFAQRIQGGLSIDKSANERIASWQKGLMVFRENPFFGVGFNNLRSAYENNNLFKQYQSDGGNSGAGVDSSFIFVLATTGAIGLLIYLSWWFLVLKRVITKSKKQITTFSFIVVGLTVGIFVNSQFINSLFYAPIMLVLYTLIGAEYGSDY